jgi:hypothetical protein
VTAALLMGICHSDFYLYFYFNMRSLRNWFIGKYLEGTTNVFEKAKVELLFNFTVFYLLNLLLFEANLVSNHFHYHATIICFAITLLVLILILFKKQAPFKKIAEVLFVQQIVTGVVSYIIQESRMDFVGEFWIVVNILVSFFTLGRRAGFIMSGFWAIQLAHCLANDLSNGKFILISIPKEEVLPPAPGFIFVPYALIIYIVYQFVKTRSIAEHDIHEQKKLVEEKNKEIIDSITYAQRIQRSILTTAPYIDKALKRLKDKP